MQMRQGLEMVGDSVGDTKYKICEEIYTQSSYHHMLARMKKDFIAAKLDTSGCD